MSSSLSAEKSPLGTRAVLVLTVFASIRLGAITSSIVYLILLSAFKSSIEHNVNHLEWVWRLLLALGIVPAALTLYARLTMRETEPYEKCESFCGSICKVNDTDYYSDVAKETSLTKTNRRGLKDQFRDFHVYFNRVETRQSSFCSFSYLVPFVSRPMRLR